MKVLSILFLAIAGASAAMPNADPDAMANDANTMAEDSAGFRGPGGPGGSGWARPPRECRPGTYSCTVNNNGWRVCDYSGHWVVSAPSRPPPSTHPHTHKLWKLTWS